MASSLTAVGQIVFHGVVQSSVGLASGLLADYLFPLPSVIATTSDLVINLIEIAGQVLL